MTTAIASNGGRCHSVVLTERYARPPRVARTHHRRSHSKLSETQFREGFSAPRYPPNVPPDHPTLDLGRQRRWGGGDYEGPPWGGTLARYLPEVPPSPFKGPLLQPPWPRRPAARTKRRPGNPQFPFPRFPIWPGIGEGIPDSRFGRNRESGNPPFPDLAGNRESGSRLAANREIGDTLCVSTSCTILGWMLP